MLPAKLERLPRSQRLRKLEKLFAAAENQLARAAPGTGELSAPLREDLIAAIRLLLTGEPFNPAIQTALHQALTALSREAPADTPTREINAVRHVLLAETGRSPADWDLIDHSGGLDGAKRRNFPGMVVYLEDIRSPFNVGAMFRSAESFGVERILLSPLCADPRHPRSLRTARGCVDILPWERDPALPFLPPPNDPALLTRPPLPVDAPPPLFALETGGVDLESFPFPRRGIMIAGSEELGVSPQALAAADASLGRLTIPTYGAKGSLNVSVAFGIALQAWARAQTRPDGPLTTGGIRKK
jgi:TrmH family RNA methyltransferase